MDHAPVTPRSLRLGHSFCSKSVNIFAISAPDEHVCLFYEKCTVDRVGKMPSNITVYDAEIKIKYSHLNQGSLTQCVYTHDQDKFEIEYFM